MYFIAVSLLVIVLDRITKMLVQSHMTVGMSIPIVEDVFNLTYILNPGAAFGMLEHNTTFFICLTAVVLIGAALARKQIMAEPPVSRYGMALFLGGAIGNLIDRINTGLVIDFFDFIVWPVFNVADIAICVGVGLIIWSMLKEESKKKEA